MTSKRHLSVSTIEEDQASDRCTKFAVCQVCGDKARIINYGALSCVSCKTFFRRRGFHTETVPTCCLKGNCPVTIQSRRSCTACRFAKCLAAGMSPELIRKEDLHEKYRSVNKAKQKLALKTIVSIPQPSLLNLLSADQSSLTTINWKLLSNVVHAFDTYSSVSETQKMVQSISLHSKHHSPAAENTLNMMGMIYTALQSFISSTADFRIMTIAEQCSLLHRNMRGSLAFCCMFVFREAGVFDNHYTENAVLPLYGSENVQSTKRISNRLDYDATIVKLMLVILSFSSNYFRIHEEEKLADDSLLFGTFRLFGSQNVYVDILWKYMLYRYGFWETVQRFDGMIKAALDSLQLGSDITDSNNMHRNYIEDVEDQYEDILKRKGSENIPLWGKES